MTRLEALEKVAEAAQKWADAKPASWVDGGLLTDEAAALYAEVANLRDLPPPSAAETVTLAMWRSKDGAVLIDVAGSPSDVGNGAGYSRLGTTTLPLDKEPGHAE